MIILVKNFKQMFPSSYSGKAWVYSAFIYEDASVQLDGLIRYDANNKYRITPKSSHIKNVIISEHTKEKNLRKYNVESLTKYQNKTYVTLRDKVIEKYNYVSRNSPVIGDIITIFI